MSNYLLAKELFDIQIEELRKIRNRIDDSFNAALKIMEEAEGKIIVTGIGKSGIIAQKIAATMTSIGSPAIFVHPSDALHGDLGIVSKDDVAIIISGTGTTSEIVSLLPHLRRRGVILIAMTGDLKSPLALESDVVLDIGVQKEACDIGLVPTSSTTAALVMGDSLAVSLAKKKGFKEEQFSSSHPGGGIGKRLKLKVKDIITYPTADIATLKKDSRFEQVIETMNSKDHYIGAIPIVSSDNRLEGLISWGDLRLALKHKEKTFQLQAKDIMNPYPITIKQDDLAFNALKIMENRERPLSILPVVDDQNRFVSLIRIHDIIGKV